MIVRALSAVLLVAAVEALLVQWTSYVMPPAVLVLDFVVTAAVLAAVVVPSALLLGRTALAPLGGEAAAAIAVAVYTASRIRTEKLPLAAAIPFVVVLVVGFFVARRRDGATREMVSEHALLGATVASIVLGAEGQFAPTLAILALLAAALAVHRISLGWLSKRFASERVRALALPTVPVLLLFGLAVASYPLVPGIPQPASVADDPPPPARPELPNVIIVVLDTVRADHLSLYGYEKPTSPELAKFAARANVFRRAVANSNWSLPSHATLLTGLLPHQHGAHTVVAVPQEPSAQDPRRVDITHRLLREELPTIAERLRDLGYDVGVVSANYGWVSTTSGLLRGFRYIDDRPAALAGVEPFCGAYIRHQPIESLRTRYARWMTTKRAADRIVEHCDAFLNQPRRGPFFLLVNFMDGHGPYHSALRAADVPEIRERFRGARWSAANLEAYDRSIAFLDHQLGRFFDGLDARKVLDESLIVITSDHGEQFGPTGRGWHGDDLSQANVHIPLLIKMPGQTNGEVLGRTGQLADVVPTILGALELPIPEEFFGSVLGERSRAVIAESYLASGKGRAPVSSVSSFVSLDVLDEKLPTQWALFDGPWKLVRDASGRRRLYDLDADPDESSDLSTREAEVVARLDRALAALLPPDAFTSYRVPIVKPDVSKATLEKLKSLGYAQ